MRKVRYLTPLHEFLDKDAAAIVFMMRLSRGRAGGIQLGGEGGRKGGHAKGRGGGGGGGLGVA